MNHCKQTVFLILLMLVLLLPLASAEGRTFITVDDCVPLEIRAAARLRRRNSSSRSGGTSSIRSLATRFPRRLPMATRWWRATSAACACCSCWRNADGNKYLQAAVWDADSATYATRAVQTCRKMRIWTPITRGMLSFCQLDTTRRDLPNRVIWTTLRGCTSRRNGRDAGAWVVTDVTDGFSFFADYDGGQYVVRDYWDEEVLQTISRDATLDTFDFVNPFAAEIGWMK